MPVPSVSLQPLMAASRLLRMDASKLKEQRKMALPFHPSQGWWSGGTVNLKGKGVGRGASAWGQLWGGEHNPLVCLKSEILLYQPALIWAV